MRTRWFVEVSPVDADTLKERYCVEAIQWQQALQQARKLRSDRGPLSRFSIELLDVGYRATDPASRIRYTVSKAPGDAPLTAGGASNGAERLPAAAATTREAPVRSAAPATASIAQPREVPTRPAVQVVTASAVAAAPVLAEAPAAEPVKRPAAAITAA